MSNKFRSLFRKEKKVSKSGNIDHQGTILEAYQGKLPYIFISYSHRDNKQVFNEIVKFQRNGYRIWYDEGIDPGNEWPDEVADALERCSYFIVFVSPNSMASQNVKNEINFALNKRKPFLAIHFQETQIPSGILLRMGDIQAIFKYKMDEGTFSKKLRRTLSESLLDKEQKKRLEASADIVKVSSTSSKQKPEKVKDAPKRIDKEPADKDTSNKKPKTFPVRLGAIGFKSFAENDHAKPNTVTLGQVQFQSLTLEEAPPVLLGKIKVDFIN